nr:late competence development ComFB family protein [Aeromonas schubertii]
MRLDNDIHNFYEHLVLNAIREQGLDSRLTLDQLADLCCLTLNHLPAHYIRHDVDMIYFLTDEQRRETTSKVQDALAIAHEKVLHSNPSRIRDASAVTSPPLPSRRWEAK